RLGGCLGQSTRTRDLGESLRAQFGSPGLAALGGERLGVGLGRFLGGAHLLAGKHRTVPASKQWLLLASKQRGSRDLLLVAAQPSSPSVIFVASAGSPLVRAIRSRLNTGPAARVDRVG